MNISLPKIAFNTRTLLIVYIVAALIASVQQVSIGTHIFHAPPPSPTAHDVMKNPEIEKLYEGTRLTEYNNYVIFRQSFFHLREGKNLYAMYPGEYWDLYKYSPTFALFMGTLAYLPDIVGLSIWNFLNAIALFLAIRMLPFGKKKQCVILWFIAIELLTAMQNSQSNGLLAALMIGAFCFMQRGRPIWATLLLVISAYIKVYGAIGFCLFLFFPQKPKFILYSILWAAVLFALPLLATPFPTLLWQYHNWIAMMTADQSAAYGLSVAGWLNSWFGITAKSAITAAGMLLFFVPFVRFNLYRNDVYRLLMLAFMLVWVIVFNHKAESPTYIIAVCGAAIWYFIFPRTAWRTAMMWLIFLFTILAPTDLYPPYFRQHFFLPYTIKAVPCILLWCVMFVDLLAMKKTAKIPV